ncbi:metallophosphoesterase family protein [Ornithinimicrobium flavum]|uniref:metallophosphoesterase family protein n=1 Tax=Ornithinimicrobium flavum TaxID=1288636 RepID=UPI00106F5074|nr:DNA repair exonuclease [Ornithinimicrobium flavum]
MVRFLHTADWQIGMTRHYLSAEAQPRFAAARTDVVRRLGGLAADLGCDFVVVAGDVFEHNQLTPQTVRRAVEALRAVPVPVFLLPGNHDHLGPMSIWSSPLLREELPPHVQVLDRAGLHEVSPGVELVAAPWVGKHPDGDPVAGVLADLAPAPEGVVRVLVGHGAVDLLDADRRTASAIAVEPLVRALDEGRVHYVALGDRHSTTQVGDDPAVWYSGAPEPTSWREDRAGEVLVVEVAPGLPHARARVGVTAHRVSRWSYVSQERDLGSEDDLDLLDTELAALPDKERTVLRLGLRGTLGLAQHARLEEMLERHAQLLGALHRPAQHSDLVLAGDDDLADLELGGFLASAAEEIRGGARLGSGSADELGGEWGAADVRRLHPRSSGRRAERP